jgi:hypothetical protein
VADVLKVLAQSNPAATTNTDIYTVPEGTYTTVSSIVICEQGGGTPTFRIAVRVRGLPIEAKQYLWYDTATVANTSVSKVIGMTLSSGDVVTVYASDTNLSFTMFGVETS